MGTRKGFFNHCLESPITENGSSHAGRSFHLLMPTFVCTEWTGEPQSMEGQQFAWVGLNDLSDYEMPAADYPLIGTCPSSPGPYLSREASSTNPQSLCVCGRN